MIDLKWFFPPLILSINQIQEHPRFPSWSGRMCNNIFRITSLLTVYISKIHKYASFPAGGWQQYLRSCLQRRRDNMQFHFVKSNQVREHGHKNKLKNHILLKVIQLWVNYASLRKHDQLDDGRQQFYKQHLSARVINFELNLTFPPLTIDSFRNKIPSTCFPLLPFFHKPRNWYLYEQKQVPFHQLS